MSDIATDRYNDWTRAVHGEGFLETIAMVCRREEFWLYSQIEPQILKIEQASVELAKERRYDSHVELAHRNLGRIAALRSLFNIETDTKSE